jgi:hypothetical protein
MSLLSPGHWWWRLRRDVRRGARATAGDYWLGPRIWRWQNPHADAPPADVPLTSVLGREHLTMVAWMLASWTTASGRNWRIVLHEDGTLPADAAARLRDLGLNISVVSRREADARTAAALQSTPLCARYRTEHPLGLKIFDVPLLQAAPRFLLIDPDVLFFQRPDEILRRVDDSRDDHCYFNKDVAEASNVSAAEARQKLGVTLLPQVNSGLCLLPTRALDLAFCERALRETTVLRGHFWRVEQTLFALCASRHGRAGLLAPTYEVSLGPTRRPDAVARHYVGAVRDRFWAEGIWDLSDRLLA